MIYYVHPAAQDLVSALIKSTVKDRSKEVIILTSYLPAYTSGPYGGIEKLKQLRLDKNCNPAILLSFESTEILHAMPGNVVLTEAGTYHLRLPFTKIDFENLLSTIEPIFPENIDEVVQRSCTLYGQLDSFVQRIISDLQNIHKNDKLILLKLRNLRKYCTRNFGNWFENVLSHAQDKFNARNFKCVSEILEMMRQHIPVVVICCSVEKFAHGQALDIVNKGLGPLRTLLISMQRGSAGVSTIKNYINSIHGFSLLVDKLISLGSDLNEQRRSFLGIHEDLPINIDFFISSIQKLADIKNGNFLIEETSLLVDAIDNVVSMTDEMIQYGEQKKSSLTTIILRMCHE